MSLNVLPPRDHEASPFFKVVRDHFDEFELMYPDMLHDRQLSDQGFQDCAVPNIIAMKSIIEIPRRTWLL